MQIDVKGIENLFVNMVLKKTFKIHKSKKAHFHFSLFGNWLNRFLIWNCHPKGQLMIPKLVPMNHHHWNN
jgi:hypothetical protein